MRPFTVLIMTAATTLGVWSTVAHGQSWQPPTAEERCPSRWGAGDERGSGNLMTPETVLRAARLIRTGEVFELGHVLSGELPFYGNRRFDVHIKRTFMNPHSNRRGSNEELVIQSLARHPVRRIRPPVDRQRLLQLFPDE